MIAEMLTEAGLDVIVADRRVPTTGIDDRQHRAGAVRDRHAARRAEAEDRRRRRGSRLAALAARGVVTPRVPARARTGGTSAQRALPCGQPPRPARDAARSGVAPGRRPRNTLFLERNALRSRFGIARGAALLGFDNLTINPRDIAARLLIRAAGSGARLFAPVDIVDISRTRSSVAATSRDGSQIRSRYLVLASGYEFPRIVPKKGHHITTTWAFATAPQRRRLWPEECLIWEASTPYLYARTTPDGRVLCGGEDAAGSVADHGEAAWRGRSRACSASWASCFPLSTPMPHSAGRPRSARPPRVFPRSARYRATGIAGSRSAMAATASPTAGSPPRSFAPR